MSPRPSPALRAAVLVGDVLAVLAAFVVALQVREAANGVVDAVWPGLLKPFGAPSHAPLLPWVLAAWVPIVAWRLPVGAAVGRAVVEALVVLGALLIATGQVETTSRAFLVVLGASAFGALLAWREAVGVVLRAEQGADPARSADRAVKRVSDVVGAIAGLVVLAPVLVLAALAIRIEGGPVLFVQERCGRFGQPFRM